MLKKAWLYSEWVTCTEEERSIIRVLVGKFDESRQRGRSRCREKSNWRLRSYVGMFDLHLFGWFEKGNKFRELINVLMNFFLYIAMNLLTIWRTAGFTGRTLTNCWLHRKDSDELLASQEVLWRTVGFTGRTLFNWFLFCHSYWAMWLRILGRSGRNLWFKIAIFVPGKAKCFSQYITDKEEGGCSVWISALH
jgi:hypothetical protein